MTTINNTQDVIDSRDVIARIEELTDERQTLMDAVEEAEETLADADDTTSDLFKAEAEEQLANDRAALAEWQDENGEELRILEDLAEEAEDYSSDWKYGETLIRDSYFETYAQELAEDCGMLENANSWPLTCIDWEQAARELQMDYSTVDFDGITYWIRS